MNTRVKNVTSDLEPKYCLWYKISYMKITGKSYLTISRYSDIDDEYLIKEIK